MDADGVPMVGQSIDLCKIEPLQHKRTLAYINHFIIQMTSMINKVGCQAEEKLMKVDERILQLQTTLQLLEAKIDSVPEAAAITVTDTKNNNPGNDTEAKVTPEVPSTAPNSAPEVQPEPEPEPSYTPVSQDPRYAKYFKMVNMGVPPAALHAKMKLEGLDPLYLDNPNQPSPPTANISGDETEDTDSSFSSS